MQNQINVPTNSDSELSWKSHHPYEYKGEFYGESPLYIGIGTWTPQAVDSTEFEDVPFNPLESASIVSILEDAIDELIILKYVIGTPVVVLDGHYKTPDERFTRRLTPERIFPEVDSKPVLTPAIKLQRDREQIELMFYKTSKTLLEDGSFSPLASAVDVLRREKDDEMLMIQELKENLKYLKQLSMKVEEKRKLDDQEEKERDELTYFLQDEMDDVILKCEVERKFVSKWESVRQAQNQWKLRMAENFFKNDILKLATKSKVEKRVTHELQSYLKMNQAELEEQLEQWMALYDSEMERRENKILHLKYNRDQAEEKKNQLHELFEKRQTEMKDWVIFREIRKKRAKASLQIQSWWRGIMVRKKLGPYKPKKSKPEKKK